MVATTTSRHFSGDLVTRLVLVTPLQSSLSSSTHSRRSLVKDSPVVCARKRRVRFACSDGLDLSDYDGVDNVGVIKAIIHEFERVDPVNTLYLTPEEMLQIRSNLRRQAAQFAADHPDFTQAINELLENGNSVDDISAQLETLRRRRRRSCPFQDSMKWLELDSNNDDDSDFEEDDASYDQYCDDEACDDKYFCPMRGLETRISPLFRIRRRWAIHSILDMQQEMQESGCCTAQIEMGLRAVCVQVSQKARLFAVHQAKLDEKEAST
jgi:hypothetical protein